jgi:hypothetical protein
MSNLKWFGKFCLVMAIASEAGSILYNLKNGYSAFYLFDLSYKFSVSNNLFIIYWGAILGILVLAADLRKGNTND